MKKYRAVIELEDGDVIYQGNFIRILWESWVAVKFGAKVSVKRIPKRRARL